MSIGSERLLAGERVLWRGRAGGGLIFTPRDIFLVPFSLVWCGFTVFWTVSATGDRAPGFFTLWGLMFVAVGLYLVAGRFVADAVIRRWMDYVVTDQRVLISRAGPFPMFTAVALDRLADVQLQPGGDGRGSIRFGPPPSWNGRGSGGWTPALDPTPQFLKIDDARRVYDLVQKAAADARRRPQDS